MPTPQVVVVCNKNMAVIVCPICNTRKRFSAIQFKETKHTIKVKCQCGEHFKVNFNFRLDDRKSVDLKGTYRKVSEHKAYEKMCQITNLSPTGIAVKVFEDFDSLKHDELIVEFSLDDDKKTTIKRKVRVCHIKGNTFGGQFFDHELDGRSKRINAYLFRFNKRKVVDFKGTYRSISEDKEDEKACQIINLSLAGLAIEFFEFFNKEKHDELVVSFSLDDDEQTIIERKVKVCHVRENSFGGQFYDHELDGKDKKIWAYIA